MPDTDDELDVLPAEPEPQTRHRRTPGEETLRERLKADGKLLVYRAGVWKAVDQATGELATGKEGYLLGTSLDEIQRRI